MNGKYVVGIDIGGTSFRIGAVCLEPSCQKEAAGEKAAGNVTGGTEQICEEHKTEAAMLGTYQVYRSHVRKVPVREVFRTEHVLEELSQYLKEYCEMLRREKKAVAAAAIGFPTTLDRGRRRVLQAPNIPFMENLPVVEVLERALGVPVLIEKDVNMSLIYDRVKYRLDDCPMLCGIYFGTGIGNAILINGRIWTGRNGTAGELGHIPVDGNHEKCGCGNEGCMENLAGGKYLARLCREVYRETEIGNLFTRHADEPLLRQFVDRMAMTVAVELNLLDPDCMVLGGGVLNMKDFPRSYLEERIRFHTRKPYPEQNLRLIFAEDEKDKAVVGAALFALQGGNMDLTH